MTQSHSTLAAALMGRLYYHLTPCLSVMPERLSRVLRCPYKPAVGPVFTLRGLNPKASIIFIFCDRTCSGCWHPGIRNVRRAKVWPGEPAVREHLPQRRQDIGGTRRNERHFSCPQNSITNQTGTDEKKVHKWNTTRFGGFSSTGNTGVAKPLAPTV